MLETGEVRGLPGAGSDCRKDSDGLEDVDADALPLEDCANEDTSWHRQRASSCADAAGIEAGMGVAVDDELHAGNWRDSW